MEVKPTVSLLAALLGATNGICALPDSDLHITQGTFTVTTNENAVPVLPDNLKTKMSLWLDATTNVVVDVERGGVVQWLDARESPVGNLEELADREASGDFEYFRAKALLDSSNPVFNATPPQLINFASLKGRPAVDFGEYQTDSKWLYFTDGMGTVPRRVNTTSFVGVIAFHDTFGFLFGDVTNLVAEGGAMCYHKSAARDLVGFIASGDRNCYGFTRGEPRLNGTRIDPESTSYLLHEQFQILSNVGPAVEELPNYATDHPFASVIFNGANFRKNSGSGKSPYDRQGGGIIAELMVFDTVLTDSERRQAESYLAEKWFGVSILGKVLIDEGASLAIGESAPDTVIVSEIAGRGVVEKDGNGRLIADRAESLDNVTFAITSGSVEIGQKQDAHVVAPVAGVSLAVSSSNLTASANLQGRFAVVGEQNAQASVLFSADRFDDMPIDISGVRATLALPIGDACLKRTSMIFSTKSNLLENGSFEMPVLVEPTTRVLIANCEPGAWFWDGGETNQKLAHYIRYGDALRTDTTQKIDGDQALALTINSNTDTESACVSQYFDAPVSGIYTVRLWMSRRESRSEVEGKLKMTLSLDGEVFCTVVNQADANGDRNKFRNVVVDLPPMSAGRHKFTIGTPKEDDATDRSLVVDGVSITLSCAGEFVKVPNPGFESFPSRISEASEDNGWYAGGLTQSDGWTFGGLRNNSTAGITQNSTWWSWTLAQNSDVASDYRKVYLRNSYASSELVFPHDGIYRFSLRFSNRAGLNRPIGHKISIFVDGDVVGTVNPVTQQQFAYAATKTISAGTKTLRIESVAPNTTPDGDYSSVIDDIRIEYLACSLTNVDSQDLLINAPSNGFYSLAVPISGDMPEYGEIDGIRNNWKSYPARTSILLDGSKVGEVIVEKPDRTPFVFRLPYLTAGDHCVTISGIADGSGPSSRRYVGVCNLMPLEFDVPAQFKDIDISLCNGAKLDLQFPGALHTTGRVKINGTSVKGLITSQTYPQWVSGPGTLSVSGKGTVLIVR